jgi:hypothetical protein
MTQEFSSKVKTMDSKSGSNWPTNKGNNFFTIENIRRTARQLFWTILIVIKPIPSRAETKTVERVSAAEAGAAERVIDAKTGEWAMAEPRNFVCRATGKLCTDGRCKRDLCSVEIDEKNRCSEALIAANERLQEKERQEKRERLKAEKRQLARRERIEAERRLRASIGSAEYGVVEALYLANPESLHRAMQILLPVGGPLTLYNFIEALLASPAGAEIQAEARANLVAKRNGLESPSS